MIYIYCCYFTCSLPLTCNMNQSPVLNLFWKNLKKVDFRENVRHRQSIVLAVAVPDLWETTRQKSRQVASPPMHHHHDNGVSTMRLPQHWKAQEY